MDTAIQSRATLVVVRQDDAGLFQVACPHYLCARVVGPYAERAVAMAAIRDHLEWRHRNWQRGDRFPPLPNRRTQP